MFIRVATLIMLFSLPVLAADVPTFQTVAASQPAPKAEPFTGLAPLVTKTVTDAEKVVRAPMPKDATTMQADEEAARRKAALQKMADDLAGKNVTGAFTVLDVVPDGRPNVVKVTGALAWKSKPIIDEESAKKIQTLNDTYKNTLKMVTGASDIEGVRRQMQPQIDAAQAEAKDKAEKRVPLHTITISVYTDQVKNWSKGQIKQITGYINLVSLKPVHTDGIVYVQLEATITPSTNAAKH